MPWPEDDGVVARLKAENERLRAAIDLHRRLMTDNDTNLGPVSGGVDRALWSVLNDLTE
jgi:hypothetical protein